MRNSRLPSLLMVVFIRSTSAGSTSGIMISTSLEPRERTVTSFTPPGFTRRLMAATSLSMFSFVRALELIRWLAGVNCGPEVPASGGLTS